MDMTRTDDIGRYRVTLAEYLGAPPEETAQRAQHMTPSNATDATYQKSRGLSRFATLFLAICTGLLLAALVVAAFAQSPDPWAFAVVENEGWLNYQEKRLCCPRGIDAAKLMGYLRAYSRFEADGADHWWGFGVEPGTVVRAVVLTTTEGTYRSQAGFFATWAQQELVVYPAVAVESYEGMRAGGERRVVAFARFATAPSGDVVGWTIEGGE